MNPIPLANHAPPASNVARTERLRAQLMGKKNLLILTHHNPDPDSLGGAMGLAEFARSVAGVESRIAITGRILRAENKAMVRELGIEVELLETMAIEEFDCYALVDSQPGFGHTFVPPGVAIDIVIDHHVCSEANGAPVDFLDVRTDVGATSSIVTEHMFNAGVQPSRDVATALAYGIKTDTADLSRNISQTDLRAYDYLFPHIDRAKLAAITCPRLPLAYFQTLKDALMKVRLYDGVSLCSLGRTTSAEMVAEVADLLLRMEAVQVVFCGGQVGDSYYVSVRTQVGGDAWRLLRQVMEGEDGTCGGHGSVAGGSIAIPGGDARALRRLERRLERNILRALGVSDSNAAALGDVDD